MANITKIGLDGKTKNVVEDLQDFTPFLAPPSKQQLLASITVTTQAGNTFDGNETARSDMLVALTVGEWINETQTYWKMANNDTLLVTKEELQEALTLAIQAKGRIVGAIE